MLTILTVYVLSMLKTILGPIMGYSAGFTPLITTIITVAGMMTTVLILTFLGEKIRTQVMQKYFKPKKVFTSRNRRFVQVWRKYGEQGISFLTPILLSPPGGAIIAMALGGDRKKTIAYMFLWSVIWSTILTYGFYYAGDGVREFIDSRNLSSN